MNGMETNEGFNLGYTVLFDIVKAAVYGDLLMKCLYRVRPYEKVKHSANALHEKWRDICVAYLVGKSKKYSHKDICKGIVEDFDALPIDESIIKPKVGIVGEILVKYMPLANNNLVDLLEKEGAEAVVPDILDFLNYSFYNSAYKRDYLGGSSFIAFATKVGIKAIQRFRKPAIEALKNSKRFEPPMPIAEIAELAKPLISIGNQYGEGWLLAGEMAELITHGTPNIVCIQPFACLPNHVVGKGVLKQLRKLYPNANVVAVDYDPGASEVNQLNRIKLMLSVAKNRIEETKGEAVKS